MNVPLLDKLISRNKKRNSKRYGKLKNSINKDIVVPEFPGWHPLHLAAYNGDYKWAEKLINDGAYIVSVDIWGRTPLHYARRRKYGAKNDKVARLLIKNGADDFSNVDNKGRTPSDIYIEYS